MLLKRVESCMENKQNLEEFINIVPSTSVDTVIVEYSSAETPYTLCEIPNSSNDESRRKERNKRRGD